jgi:hypothetical protein
MDNFQPIALSQVGRGPFCAGNDGAIQLNGDAIALQVEGRDQILQWSRGDQLRKLTRMAI